MAEEEQKVFNGEENGNNGDAPEAAPQEEEAAPQKPEGPPEAEAPRDDICRDFLKNICNRGSRCKFYHPPENKARVEEHINFCIDYQNRGCLRDNCRFVHASREEVERYKVTREVTLPLARAIAAVSHGDTIAGIPLCKEFQSGKCLRGAARCRYWHVNVEEERERRARGLPPGPPIGRYAGAVGRYPTPGYGAPMGPGMRRPGGPMDGGPYDKRPRMEDQRMIDLERKNADLMKEVETLKRELQREHERYEDLYALFRQQTASAVAKPAPPAPPAAAQGYAASYAAAGWNPSGGGW